MNISTRTKLLSIVLLSSIACQAAVANDDPYLWLEKVEGKKALKWVEKSNNESLGYLKKQPLYKKLYKKNLKIYNSKDRIPEIEQMGKYYYNFWRDEKNTRGIWRRTTLAEYKKDKPKWEPVLDLDILANNESENWVYKDAKCLAPSYQRCMLSLSRGGSDALVMREFDISTKTFVQNGFRLSEAKSTVEWLNQDTLIVATDFGTNTLTKSGYPNMVKQWKRGQDLNNAKTIFEGSKTDVGIFLDSFFIDGKTYIKLNQIVTFHTSEIYLFSENILTKLNRPKDSYLFGISGEKLIFSLSSDWRVDDKVYPQASLLSIGIEDSFAGNTNFKTVLLPEERSSLRNVSITKDYLIVNILKDVTSELYRYQLTDKGWSKEKIEIPELGSVKVTGSSSQHNNFFVEYNGFLTPTTSYYYDHKVQSLSILKKLPSLFNAKNYKVEQHFAAASDGTKIPYFLIMKKNIKYHGKNPTLLYGYGGFQISRIPNYSPTIGIDWLEQGGVYVIGNIRGGGEYGPSWHQAALKEKRHVAFTDFITVAEDLVKRKITSPQHLGIHGGSNGGLLVGAVVTMRPDLFNAVVCQVPLLDMKRYNKLLAGASWMAEYGNPDNEKEWNYIKQYSPYHNVYKDVKYPKIFFTTSTKDDRVHPAHARKMAAKMQAQGHEVFYYENTEGGHGGAANNEQVANVNALIYTYLVDQLR